jgi:hypothetical protein
MYILLTILSSYPIYKIQRYVISILSRLNLFLTCNFIIPLMELDILIEIRLQHTDGQSWRRAALKHVDQSVNIHLTNILLYPNKIHMTIYRAFQPKYASELRKTVQARDLNTVH